MKLEKHLQSILFIMVSFSVAYALNHYYGMWRPGSEKGNIFYPFSEYMDTIKLHDAVAADATQINPLIYKGLALYNQSNFTEALQYFDKALSIDPRNAEALNDKADALRKLGNNTEALKYYDKALDIDPKNPDALNDKGVAFENLGNNTEALKYYDKALDIDSRYIDSMNNKGIVSLNLKNYTKALKYFDEALGIDPNSLLALSNKGLALTDLGNYEEATKYYDRVLDIDPKNPDALDNKGNVLRKLGNNAEALKYFNKALTIDPNHISALGHKGSILTNLGRYEEALIYYDKALKKDPNNVFTLSNKAINLNDLGRYEEAQAIYNKLLGSNASSPSTTLAYQNSSLGIQMQYPSNWKVEKHGSTPLQPGVIFTPPFDRNSTNFPVKLSIDVDSSEGKSLEKITSEQITNLRNDSDNILNATTINISGNNPASQIFYTGDVFGLPTKEMAIYTIHDDQLYTIWYLAQPNTYSNYIPDVQRMIDSIKFLDTNKSITSNGVINTYQNATLGIRLQYLSDWTMEEKHDGPVFQPPDSIDSGAYVQVTVGYLDYNTTLNEELHKTINDYTKQAEDFRVIKLSTNGTVEGIPVYDLLSMYKENGSDDKLRTIGMLLPGDKEVSIKYFSKAETYDTNLDAANKIIDSIEVTETRDDQFNKATNLAVARNYTGAISYFDKMLDKNATDIDALNYKGLALDKLGNFTGAVKYFDKVLSLDASNRFALKNEGYSLANLHNYTGAMSYYDKMLGINSTDIDALFDKGLALNYLKNYTEALKYFDKALTIDPNSANLLLGKAIALDNLGRTQQAINYFDKALAIDPKNVYALNGKSLLVNRSNN